MVDLWCFPASQILYWMLPAWREKVRHKLHAVWQKHKKPSQVVKCLKNKYIYESIIVENADEDCEAWTGSGVKLRRSLFSLFLGLLDWHSVRDTFPHCINAATEKFILITLLLPNLPKETLSLTREWKLQFEQRQVFSTTSFTFLFSKYD